MTFVSLRTIVLATALATMGIVFAGEASAACLGHSTEYDAGQNGVYKYCTGVKYDGTTVECVGNDESGGGSQYPASGCHGIRP